MATSSSTSTTGSYSANSSQEVYGHNIGSHSHGRSNLSADMTPSASSSTIQAFDGDATFAASSSHASTSSSTLLDPTPGAADPNGSSLGDMSLPSHSAKVRKIPTVSDEAIPEWRYEMRREAQEIVPGLFVGPYQSSRLLEPLQTLSLTHIVCVYDEREKAFVKPRFPEHFTYLALEVRDAADQNLIRLFPQVRQFIDDALRNSGRVLVHCGDGISRSPAIVTAYVMVTFNTTHEEAFSHVQSRRFCVSPNTNFQRQIEAYEDIHKASLAMANYSRQADEVAVQRRKRGELFESELDDDDDEELKERNLLAQRKRRGSEEEEEHHFVGEQHMDTN